MEKLISKRRKRRFVFYLRLVEYIIRKKISYDNFFFFNYFDCDEMADLLFPETKIGERLWAKHKFEKAKINNIAKSRTEHTSGQKKSVFEEMEERFKILKKTETGCPANFRVNDLQIDHLTFDFGSENKNVDLNENSFEKNEKSGIEQSLKDHSRSDYPEKISRPRSYIIKANRSNDKSRENTQFSIEEDEKNAKIQVSFNFHDRKPERKNSKASIKMPIMNQSRKNSQGSNSPSVADKLTPKLGDSTKKSGFQRMSISKFGGAFPTVKQKEESSNNKLDKEPNLDMQSMSSKSINQSSNSVPLKYKMTEGELNKNAPQKSSLEGLTNNSELVNVTSVQMGNNNHQIHSMKQITNENSLQNKKLSDTQIIKPLSLQQINEVSSVDNRDESIEKRKLRGKGSGDSPLVKGEFFGVQPTVPKDKRPKKPTIKVHTEEESPYRLNTSQNTNNEIPKKIRGFSEHLIIPDSDLLLMNGNSFFELDKNRSNTPTPKSDNNHFDQVNKIKRLSNQINLSIDSESIREGYQKDFADKRLDITPIRKSRDYGQNLMEEPAFTNHLDVSRFSLAYQRAKGKRPNEDMEEFVNHEINNVNDKNRKILGDLNKVPDNTKNRLKISAIRPTKDALF